jgi:hypothetical protein
MKKGLKKNLVGEEAYVEGDYFYQKLEELFKKIDSLIVEEMLIADKENQPTSRLTSLLAKIHELR